MTSPPRSRKSVPDRQRSRARGVERVVHGVLTSDGAGVTLTRTIGQAALPDLDPFLLLDEFRSESAAEYIAGFPDHPHRGFETVTYMLAGRMRHADNQGNVGLLRPGSVQWMTAGRGIVHSEMPEQENGLLWGFQLWVNLPASEKMTPPRYREIDPGDIPTSEREDGVLVRAIAGEVDGIPGAITGIATRPTYLDVTLPPGTRFSHELPTDDTAFIYVFDGGLRVGDAKEPVAHGELAVLGPGETVALSAGEGEGGRLLLVAGRPLGEPVARHGPFVMNTDAEVRQAVEDYRAGRF